MPSRPQTYTAHIASPGAYQITQLTAPDSVSANSPFTATVSVEADDAPLWWQPDYCVASDLSDATRVDIRAFQDGDFIGQQRRCLPSFIGTDKPRSAEFQFLAPPLGSTELRFVVEGAASGEVLAERTATVQVSEQAPSCPAGQEFDPVTGGCVPIDGGGDTGDGDGGGCSQHSDCPQGTKCQDGQCVPCGFIDGFLIGNCRGGGGGGGLFGSPVVILAFLLVVLFILAQASGE